MQVGVNDDNQDVCQLEGCTNIDLLAARCTNCGKLFCGHHISSSAHHCTGIKDAVVLTCPLCNRVVPKEFPTQAPDEAVSRHMDRGCKDLPRSAFQTKQTTQWPQRPTAGAGHRLGNGGGSPMTPGGTKSWCAVPGCHNAHSKEKQVICDRCRKGFCIEHRSPAQHKCQGKPETKTTVVTSTEQRGVGSTSPKPSLANDPVEFNAILRTVTNTPSSAIGKATERAEDMVVPLVCFAIPATAPGSSTTTFQPVPSFFMNVAKSVVVGRVVDTAVSEASNKSGSVFRPPSGVRWCAHAVPVGLSRNADVTSAMFPALPLSKFVRDTPLGGSPSGAPRNGMVVVISPSPQLPEEVLKAIFDAPSKPANSKDKDNCRLM